MLLSLHSTCAKLPLEWQHMQFLFTFLRIPYHVTIKFTLNVKTAIFLNILYIFVPLKTYIH